MKPYSLKACVIKAGLAATALLLAGAAMAQSAVTLTAGPTSVTLPDGQNVPMWGYTCGDALATPAPSVNATCTAANGQPQSGTTWQPPLITVPSGQTLTITLVNKLSFNFNDGSTNSDGSPKTNSVPTSLTIVGQLGGGLGLPPQRMASPIHAPQGATWPGTLGPVSATVSTVTVTNGGSGYTSAPTVAISGGGGTGATATAVIGDVAAISLTNAGAGYTSAPTVTIAPPACTTGCWAATASASIDTTTGAVTGITVTNAGSGYTSAPTVTITGSNTTPALATASIGSSVTSITVGGGHGGSGYTSEPSVTISGGGGTGALAQANLATSQSGDAPTFVGPAQIDRVRSFATEVHVSDTAGKQLTWSSLRPGTYLIESGTEPSIQGPMGLYGVVVVTEPDNTTSGAHVAYGVNFDASVPLLLSEIDPVQNREVAAVVQNPKFTTSATYVWNGGKNACGDVSKPSSEHWCYPPAINYSPLYYLVNGMSFDRSNPSASALSVPQAAAQGSVLLRFVNAGLRVHVPSVVGATLTLLAQDGFKLPGAPKQQNEIVMPAGKTYDATIQPTQLTATGGTCSTLPCYTPATVAVYDRTLDLSTDNQHDGGMQAYINVAGGAPSGEVGSAASAIAAHAYPDSYNLVRGNTLVVDSYAKGVIANDIGIAGVAVQTPPAHGTLTLNANGTFTYAPAASAVEDTFQYCGNGSTSSTSLCTTVTLTPCTTSTCIGAAPTASNDAYTSNIATRLQISPPGVLENDTDPSNLPMTAAYDSSSSCTAPANATLLASTAVTLNADGSFTAAPSTPGTYYFCYQARNSQNTLSSSAATVTVTFPTPSNLAVNIYDAPSLKPGMTPQKISDYRWIIEEDKTFFVDPKCQENVTPRPLDSNGKPCPALPVESLAYSFHTSNMPVVAQGCVGPISCESGQTVLDPSTGGHVAAVCDVGDGSCRTDATQMAEVSPSAVHLDPNKRYYISILPGDAGNPTIGGAGGPDASGKPFDILAQCKAYTDGLGSHAAMPGAWVPGGPDALCGHTMGGASIPVTTTVDSTTNQPVWPAVKIGLQEQPLPTSKISVFVYQDDNPLNGENDAGGGVDVIAPNEAGLGGFNLTLYDQAGLLGDATGQITYDQFNEPVTNALAGHKDPLTGLDACPITKPQGAIVGTIPTCPKYESDGKTLSPLAGQAIIDNMYPGLYEVVASPAASRIARGEEWLQTSTLDGTKPIEAFLKPGEPGYFQEFGPGGYHVMIGFANPQIINERRKNTAGTGMCDLASGGGGGLACDGSLNVQVTSTRMSRTPDQRLYSSGNYDAYAFTQCYVAVGIPDGEDFAFAKCDDKGQVHFKNLPTGNFKLTVFDQWNDLTLDGLVQPVTVASGDATMHEFPVTQWRTDLYTRTYIDQNGDGKSEDGEPGLTQVNTNLRYRDGSIGFFNSTDNAGYASFNEVFPFMDWLVAETSLTRYKATGEHVVYDAGGPADGTPGGGDSTIASHLANTIELNSVPDPLRVPGAVYCTDADCSGQAIGGNTGSVGTIAVTNGGSGYSTAPTVVISGPTGLAATATATVSGGAVTGFTGLVGGSGYSTTPSVTITGGSGSGATATASIDASGTVTSLTVTNGGSGYTTAPTVTIASPSISATATATIAIGAVSAITVDPGSSGYTTAPAVTITGGGGSGATATATIDTSGTVTGIAVTSGGSGYTSVPTVTISAPDTTTGTQATATATVDNIVTAVTVTDGGGGYTTAPIVSFTGGGGSGAMASASLVATGNPVSCTTDTSTGKTSCNGQLSTGRIDPPLPWGSAEGWQGMLGQDSFIEFGEKPFLPNENGGITGQVIYASTRPFDDPALELQLSWEPGVPHVKVNLYQESTAPDGTKSLKLVDTTTSASWDDWAQGFRRDASGNLMVLRDSSGNPILDANNNQQYIPNMNCPGQDPYSPFFQTLRGSKQWLDTSKLTLANDAQFKCYDGWAMLNQIQPAPYDGYYKFPSITASDPATGKPSATNCKVCTPNPDDGTPMLPPGKYVVEAVTPPGFEIVKEEDKNILLGDVFIAPVTQQFAGFGNIFIMPDQASVNAFYNQNNPGNLNLTTSLGAVPRHEGDTGSVEAFWPCVGDKRIVPDLISLYPGAQQAAPFAGATRNLCDRKEVTLEDQMSALAKFYVFTSTHIAGHYTGTITNDFASEFDPFSPQFGEKFGPPNLPVAFRDFYGDEVSRVYSDQWGVYDGLYFSSWTVNPPNPTGYAPQMAIACMNDPGPILDTQAGSPTNGQMITDPAYNAAYSDFCYETPFMPGDTAYMDTPVIPVQGFADQYNLPDSEYPDGTPAIKSVVSGEFAGPWVSGTLSTTTLTITALGNKVVQNPAFSGPNANTVPFDQKTITRDYGFGTQCKNKNANQGCPAVSSVTIGGVDVTDSITHWDKGLITLNVNNGLFGNNKMPSCNDNGSNPSYGTPDSNGFPKCGEIVITRGDNGKQSVDTVTLTVGGKTPTLVTPDGPTSTEFGQTFPNPLQTAIDNAAPGDLLIVAPGTYREHLIMWKPVRLQGVGAESVTINADAHPAGNMDPWRRQVDCVFGLTLEGTPNPGNVAAKFDPSGTYSCPDTMFHTVDRIPLEGILGWDVTLNGNLAQLLQEPTLMGAYEGAGITVLGRGVFMPPDNTDFWGQSLGEAAFPPNSRELTAGDCSGSTSFTGLSPKDRNYVTSNFLCHPSRIDGVSIINSSQGGGGVFIHGWNHYMEVANTRIHGNQGTLAGAINIGNGETPPLYVNDGTTCVPGAAGASYCPPFGNDPVTGAPTSLVGVDSIATGGAIPFQLNVYVHVHNNEIINNASIGDALFSGTPSGAGGVSISAGADRYVIDHNWIAGNLSTGDGGGIEHQGLSFYGTIAHNVVLVNQATNPTLPVNGGGIAVTGANSDRILQSTGLECGSTNDVDCPPGIGDGAGPGLVIDANLIMGNSAESGSGGGITLQQLNGQEVGAFNLDPSQWYDATITNNIIANNVAGWDGGGVSMQDALKVRFVNNTVVSNDTTATAGVLFKELGAIMAASPPPGCTPTPDPTQPQNPNCLGNDAQHGPQPAGLVTEMNTPNLQELMPATVTCPAGFRYEVSGSAVGGLCRDLSLPVLTNDMFWQNRAFSVNIVDANGNPVSDHPTTPTGSGLLSQQNIIALTPRLTQTTTGECVAGANYWDVGVRRDDLFSAAINGTKLTLDHSILTDSTNNTLSASTDSTDIVGGTTSPVVAQYCNGARIPPEACSAQTNLQVDPANCHGYNAPVGRSETTGLTPVFVFSGITPSATVDEGNNWLNLTYGPLTLSRLPGNPTGNAAELMVASPAVALTGGAYSTLSSSSAVDHGTSTDAPATDFFGNSRPSCNCLTGNSNKADDIGAVEVQ